MTHSTVIPRLLGLALAGATPMPVEFVTPTTEVEIPSGGSRLVPVQVVNWTDRSLIRGRDNLHHVDAGGDETRYPYRRARRGWRNGIAVEFEEEAVAPGCTATYRVPIVGRRGFSGRAVLRLRFGHDDVVDGPVHSLRLVIR